MKKTRLHPPRPVRLLAALLSVMLLAPAGCQMRKGSKAPDLVVFATGNLFGQLQVCG